MIIGISGKNQNDNDTVGKIIQYLTSKQPLQVSIEEFITKDYWLSSSVNITFQIKKFTDKLKDIVCLLIGCTREQLEDEDFKNSKLPDEWAFYGFGEVKGSLHSGVKIDYLSTQCNSHFENGIDANAKYICKPTYRDLLQYIGTDLFRNQLHENVWVNSLMSKYRAIGSNSYGMVQEEGDEGRVITYIPLPLWEPHMFPNWIITDCRFPNEAKAIKDKGGIIIRVNRPIDLRFPELWELYPNKELLIEPNEEAFFEWLQEYDIKLYKKLTHESETDLDNYEFDYVIDNNSTIEELINQLREILIKEKII